MDVVLWLGAGQIGAAIVRRIGFGRKIIIGDINPERAENAAQQLEQAGFDAAAFKTDATCRGSVRELIEAGSQFGSIAALVHCAGVSPANAAPEEIIRTNLYGAALVLEEVGRVISVGGAGLVVSDAAGKRLTPLGAQTDSLIAECPAEELLKVQALRRENIADRAHAGALAAYGVSKRVMSAAVGWGMRAARINAVSVGLVTSKMSRLELSGSRGEYLRNMYMKSPLGRMGTPDELAGIAEFLMSERGSLITGADITADGGITAEYFCGALKPR